MNDRWQGFHLHLAPDSIHTDRYEVRFWPAAHMSTRGPIGHAKGTMVTIEDHGDLKVIAFSPPSMPSVSLDREAFERKALEVVREHLSAGSMASRTPHSLKAWREAQRVSHFS